jgi:hypothetical protein
MLRNPPEMPDSYKKAPHQQRLVLSYSRILLNSEVVFDVFYIFFRDSLFLTLHDQKINHCLLVLYDAVGANRPADNQAGNNY